MIEWVSGIFDQLSIMEDTIVNNNDEIFRQLDEIRERLKGLDAKLDEEILRAAKTGVRHIVDGLNSDVEVVKNDEFLMARHEFGKLIHLDPEGITDGLSGSVDNKYLIALGHWGNYHYFNIRGDKRNAAIQVYECTGSFPLIGLNLFPKKFFSVNYASLLSCAFNELDKVQISYDELSGENLLKNVWYYTKKGFVIVTAGAAGLTVAAIAGALTGGAAAPPGFLAAKAVWEELDIAEPNLHDTGSLKVTIDQLQKRIEDYLHQLEQECAERFRTLQKLSTAKLMALCNTKRKDPV